MRKFRGIDLALHKSLHTYIVAGSIAYIFVIVLYTLQPFIIYRHRSFTINDPEIQLLESVSKFDIYIINRCSDTDVVYLHGSRINPKIHLEIAKNLSYNVILPFYPGFCTSEGLSSEIEIKKCMLHLADILTQRRNKVKIFGQSIGTAVAYFLSTIIDYDRMVLENSFKNLDTVVKRRWYGFLRFLLYERWSNEGIEEAINIVYLISEHDNFVGKDYSYHGNNRVIILKEANHFNAYKTVPNYYEVVNEALNDK